MARSLTYSKLSGVGGAVRILGTTCSATAVFPALALRARLIGRSRSLTNRKPDSSCQWLSCCLITQKCENVYWPKETWKMMKQYGYVYYGPFEEAPGGSPQLGWPRPDNSLEALTMPCKRRKFLEQPTLVISPVGVQGRRTNVKTRTQKLVKKYERIVTSTNKVKRKKAAQVPAFQDF